MYDGEDNTTAGYTSGLAVTNGSESMLYRLETQATWV